MVFFSSSILSMVSFLTICEPGVSTSPRSCRFRLRHRQNVQLSDSLLWKTTVLERAFQQLMQTSHMADSKQITNAICTVTETKALPQNRLKDPEENNLGENKPTLTLEFQLFPASLRTAKRNSENDKICKLLLRLMHFRFIQRGRVWSTDGRPPVLLPH